MKTKIPILIAAGLFLAIVTNAQCPGGYVENRVVIQGRVIIPGPPVIAFEYYNTPREQYAAYHDRGNRDYDRYEDRRDWREVEYERYCRENRKHRKTRQEFYRDCGNDRSRTYYPKHREADCR